MPTLSKIPRGIRKIREDNRGMYLNAYDYRFEPHPLYETKFSEGDRPVSIQLKDQEGLQVGKTDELKQGEYLETWYTKTTCKHIEHNLELAEEAPNYQVLHLLMRQDLKNPYRNVFEQAPIVNIYGCIPLDPTSHNYWKRTKLWGAGKNAQLDLIIAMYAALHLDTCTRISLQKNWGVLEVTPYNETPFLVEQKVFTPNVQFYLVADVIEGSPFSYHNVEDTIESSIGGNNGVLRQIFEEYMEDRSEKEKTVYDPENRVVGTARVRLPSENVA